MTADPLSRRAMLAGAAGLAFAGTAACADPVSGQSTESGRRLVAFFTRSGNTKVIAGTVHRALRTDLFEIRPARPYPEDYEETVDQARQERDRRTEPPLAERVTRIGAYDELYLGFPIWGGTTPPIIRSFLRAHDLRGKSLRPFITHGGYGVGDSASVLASHAPGAMIMEPFVMEADQERRTMNEVVSWLRSNR